jgi:hypothetical protein
MYQNISTKNKVITNHGIIDSERYLQYEKKVEVSWFIVTTLQYYHL